MKTTEEETQKGRQPEVQNKPDDKRVPTVTPDNDNGDPGPPAADKDSSAADADSSNKDKGPSGENL